MAGAIAHSFVPHLCRQACRMGLAAGSSQGGTEMKYFLLFDFELGVKAMEEVWLREDMAQLPRTGFNMSADSGRGVSIWTEDPIGEALLRWVLQWKENPFQEGDEQQVRTWIDDKFKGASWEGER